MTTRDSGLIDLFAIHKEEEARASAVPSAPPPAMSFDVAATGGFNGIDDPDIEGFAAAQARSRARMKLIGGIVGGLSVIGIVIAGIVIGGAKETAKPSAAAAEPPPPAVVAPPPPAVEPPPPVAVPPPPATAKAKSDYTPATAAAAYAAQQGQAKKKPVAKPAARSVGAGVKMMKVQSSGVPAS